MALATDCQHSLEPSIGGKIKPAVCALSPNGKSFDPSLRMPQGCLRALGVSPSLFVWENGKEKWDKGQRRSRLVGSAKRTFWSHDESKLIELYVLAMKNYLILARRHHPTSNNGGDRGPMQRLNSARDQLRKLYRKRGLIALLLAAFCSTSSAQYIKDITPTPCYDCDDTRSDVHPRAPELCDGRDNDCDGLIDEGCPVLPVVTIRATKPNVLESSSVAVRVDRTGPVTAKLKVFYAIGGTATAGADYATLKGFAMIQSNKTFCTFKVKTVDDSASEPAETVELRLMTNAAYRVGNPLACIVGIVDND